MSNTKANAIKQTISTVVSYRRSLARHIVSVYKRKNQKAIQKIDVSTTQFILALVLERWVSVKRSVESADGPKQAKPETMKVVIDNLVRFHQPDNLCFEILNDLSKSLAFVSKYGPADIVFWDGLFALDWLNDQGAPLKEEFFGRIYEELRKETLVIKKGKGHFETNADRRDNGKYYTPADVTAGMVSEVLEKWRNSRLGNELSGESLRVLDPTVGAGAFLIQMARALYESPMFSGGEQTDEEIRKTIVEDCLFGIDIDREALAVCKMSLWLWVQPCEQPVVIDRHFIHQNILSKEEVWQELLGTERFHMIIGNPPYVKVAKSSLEHKQALSIGLKTADVFNLYAFVYEIALRYFLHPQGIQSLIIPLDVTCGKSSERLRAVLLDSGATICVHNFDSVPGYVFNQGKVEQHSDGKSITQRTAIVVCDQTLGHSGVYTTELIRWRTKERHLVFPKRHRSQILIDPSWDCRKGIPKIGSSEEMQIFLRLHSERCTVIERLCQKSTVADVRSLRIPTAIRYFIHAHRYEPEFVRAGATLNPKLLQYMELLYIYINSNLFYWYWRVMGNGFILSKSWIEQTPIAKIDFLDWPKVKVLYEKLTAAESSCRVVKRNANKDVVNYNFNLRFDLLMEIDVFFLGVLELPLRYADYFLHSKSNSIYRDRASLEDRDWYIRANLQNNK